MIQRYKSTSLALLGAGLVLQVIGNQIAASNGEHVTGVMAIVAFPFFLFSGAMLLLYEPRHFFTHVNIPIFMLGSALVIAGFVYYAKAKGRSGWFGLFGFVFPLGLLVFAVLTDKSAVSKHPRLEAMLKWFRRSLYTMFVLLYVSLVILGFDVTWLFIDTPRLSAQLERMATKCESVAVNVHVPYKLPSSKTSVCYVLRGDQKAQIFAEVTHKSFPAHQRDFASAYVISLFMYDKTGTPYCIVSVQPSSAMVTDTQMRSIIQAATLGEPLDDCSFVFGDRPQIDSFLLRKCTE